MSELVNFAMIFITGAGAASWVWYFIILPCVQTHKMIKERRADIVPVRIEKEHPSAFHHV